MSADAADGLEFALMDDGHAVANRLDFAEFVRGKENGFALVLQPLDDFADFHAAQGIKAAGGFVEDEQIGIVDQRLGEADALLHAFGIGFDRTFAACSSSTSFSNGSMRWSASPRASPKIFA